MWKGVQSMGENLGRQIKEMREASGMSRAELARILEVSPRQIQRFENGERLSVVRLLQIAEAFGVPVNVFMVDDGAVRKRRSKYLRLSTEETKLIRLYRGLRSKRLKKNFIGMLESLQELRN